MKRPRRRQLLAGIGGLGSLAAGRYLGSPGLFGDGLTLSADVPTGVWQERGRGPRRSGYAPDADGPTDEFSEQWRVGVDWANDAYIGSIVVDENHVYVPETDALVAIDRADGSESWRFEPPSVSTQPFDTPIEEEDLSLWGSLLACRDGRVFVTARPDGFDVLYAVDAATGSVAWALPDTGGITLLGDGLVCYASNEDYCIDAESGQVRTTMSGMTYGAVYIDGTVHEFGEYDRFPYVTTNRYDGPDRAFVTVESTTNANDHAVTADGVAFTVVDSRRVEADHAVVDVRNGASRLVSATVPHPTVSVTDGERWYVFGSESAAALPAVDPGIDGDPLEPQWQRSVDTVVGRPAVTDAAVYVPTEAGLLVLDPGTGEVLTHRGGHAVGEWGWWSPVVAGDTLYCRLGDSDDLHAFR